MTLGQRAKLLIVDDEPDIVQALATYLEGALGVDVVQAHSGADAVTILEKGGIDLILSDFRMPGMDGLQLLGIAHERWPDIPRLLLTAYPDMQLAIHALNDARIAQFLSKPVQPEQLANVVQAVLHDSRVARQRKAALGRAGSVPGKPPA